MHTPQLYLASKSPRRSELLYNLSIPFKLVESPYKERLEDVLHLSPEDKAAKLAGLKAFHAAGLLSKGVVIGADTIVVQGDNILGKPQDRQSAAAMLHSLSGRHHLVITGIAVVDVEGLRTFSHAETTKVFFRELSEKEVIQYLDTEEPYDKAGAYGIQGRASLFAEKIEGCYFNVVGFPIVAFRNLLKQLDIVIEDYIRTNK